MNKGKLSSALRIVTELQKCLEVAEDKLPSEGHDDEEALLVILSKALDTARNVARKYGKN